MLAAPSSRGKANTPTDAIPTFFSSGMNALVIGSFLIELHPVGSKDLFVSV
jgi:hypothetical protein